MLLPVSLHLNHPPFRGITKDLILFRVSCLATLSHRPGERWENARNPREISGSLWVNRNGSNVKQVDMKEKKHIRNNPAWLSHVRFDVPNPGTSTPLSV